MYDADFDAAVERGLKALESIGASLEKLANPLLKVEPAWERTDPAVLTSDLSGLETHGKQEREGICNRRIKGMLFDRVCVRPAGHSGPCSTKIEEGSHA